MKLKKILITIFLLIVIKISFSQEDINSSFIIKNETDTIFGTIRLSPNQEYCLFKRVDDMEFKKYFPNEIDAIKIKDEKYFVSKQVIEPKGDLKWYFLEYLVDGEIDLYIITSVARYFIEKDGMELIEINDNIKIHKKIDGKDYIIIDKKYLGYLRLYMSEAPELHSKINSMNALSQKKLVKLSVDYHNTVCKNYQCINYTKEIPSITFKIETLTGFNRHNSYYSPHFGFLIHFNIPLKSRQLYIKGGILYSDSPYDFKSRNTKNEKDYGFLIPVSFQYVFGNKAFKPTIALGTQIYPVDSYQFALSLYMNFFQGGFQYSLSDKFELNFSSSIDGLAALSFGLHKDLFNNNFGHSFNFGLLYKIK